MYEALEDKGSVAVLHQLPGHLASRASRAIKPALSYFDAFLKAKARQWSVEDPEGNIIMTVAENRLTADMMQARLLEVGNFPLDMMGYQDMTGIPRLREAFANVLEATFMQAGVLIQGIEVNPNHICISAGCGAVLENLFFCISSPGDGVLVPAPYYPAFDNDLEAKSSVYTVPVYLEESADVTQQLESARQAAAAAGRPISALLITNPNNPLGTMYSTETLLQMLRWCLLNQVHLVSDEIYGNSVFEDGKSFTSLEVVARQEAANLAYAERLPDLLHVVFGLSKDFCASGLRVGCLHTRNAALLKAYGNLGYFCCASNHTQWLLAGLLEDREWLAAFFSTNKSRMKIAYNMLTAALDEANISYVAASAAMFCWIDLRKALEAPTWEAENAFWEKMVQAGILITPGQQCHAAEPGFFRICWSWVPAEALAPGIQRIQKLLPPHWPKA